MPTDSMPRAEAARAIRMAISPRLAMNTRLRDLREPTSLTAAGTLPTVAATLPGRDRGIHHRRRPFPERQGEGERPPPRRAPAADPGPGAERPARPERV